MQDETGGLSIHLVKCDLHYFLLGVDVAQLYYYDAEGLIWSPDPGYWWCCAPVLSGWQTVVSGRSHWSVLPARYHLKVHLYLS